MWRRFLGFCLVMLAMVGVDFLLGATAEYLNAYEVLRRTFDLPLPRCSERFVVGQDALGAAALAWGWLLWSAVALTVTWLIAQLLGAMAQRGDERKGKMTMFERRKILITGASRGIGLAMAEQLSLSGADVLICGRDATRLQGVAERLGVRAIRCDVTDEGDRARLEHSIRGELGGLDILINNAGVQLEQDVVDGLESVEVAKEVAVNLVAPIQLTSLMLPHLLASAAPQIVNITSGLAIAPSPRSPVYAASKAGLSTWTHALRLQLAHTPVNVLEVVPPVVATEMTLGRQTGALTPDEVARAVMAALVRRDSRLAIGKIRVLDLIYRLSPRLARRVMARR